MTQTRILLATPLLFLLSACGGGGNAPKSDAGPANASALVYTDPISGAFQFKRNPTLSSRTHLVLDLWGPASLMGSGATVSLSADGAKVDWTAVNGADAPGSFVANGTVFDLGAGVPILKAVVRGNTLVATVAEKGCASPKVLNGPLLRVALDLKDTATPAGAVVALTVDVTRSKVLLGDGTLAPMSIAVGALSAL